MDHLDQFASGRTFGLDALPFPRALAGLKERGASGTLSLRVGPVEKNILLKDGVPAHVGSNIAEEAIERLLVKRGELEESVASEAMGTAVATGRDVAEVLVDMGAMRPDQLFTAMKRCMGMSILEAFAWTRGQLTYDANLPDLVSKILLKVNPGPLVVRGVCSYSPIDIVRADFPELDGRYTLRASANETLPSLRLNTVQSRMAHALAQSSSCGELASVARVDVEQALRLLYALVVLGVAIPADEAESRRPAPAAPAQESTPALASPRSPEPALASSKLVPASELLPTPEPTPEGVAASAPEGVAASAPEGVAASAPEPAAASAPEPVAASAPEPAAASGPEPVAASAVPAVRFRPRASGPPPLSAIEKDTIDRMYLMAKSRDYFELLSVERTCTFDELKRSFLDLCHRFSPMSYRDRTLADQKERVEELFLTLVTAFSTLAVPQTRKQYVTRISGSSAKDVPASGRRGDRPAQKQRNVFSVNAPRQACPAVQTAATFINTGEPAIAVETLNAAITDNPRDPLVLAFLGYALYLSDPATRLSDAMRCLDHASTADQGCFEAFLFLGRIYDVEQDLSGALDAYRECLRIKPHSEEARGATSRLEVRLR